MVGTHARHGFVCLVHFFITLQLLDSGPHKRRGNRHERDAMVALWCGWACRRTLLFIVPYSWWMRSFPTVGVPQADGLVSRTMSVLNVLRLHGRSSSFPRLLHWCKKMVTTLFFVSEVSHQNNHRSAPPSHPPRCVQFVAETKRLIFLQLLFSDLSSNRSSRSVSSPSRPPSSCSSLPTTSHQS